MREKYIFLIGLGVGIVFTTIIAFFSYNITIKSSNIPNQVEVEQTTKTTQLDLTTEITTETVSYNETITISTTKIENMETLTTSSNTKQIKAKSLLFTSIDNLCIL